MSQGTQYKGQPAPTTDHSSSQKAEMNSIENPFFVQTVLDWNHLIDKIVNAKTLTSFKEALTKEDLTPRIE